MSDRDKVISHFQDAIAASRAENRWRFVRVDMIEDAIALLREQEPVEPWSAAWSYLCGECKKPLRERAFAYCPRCGRKVDWNA